MDRLTAFAALTAWIVSAFAFAADRLVPSQYPTIQAAITASAAGDRVLVARGIYVERINLSGKAITLLSVEGSAVTTITPGSATGAVVTCSSSETAACVIDGFTITGATNGPGIQIVTASPTIRNCVISQNLNSSTNGAGVAFTGSGGNPTFTDCFFIGNVSNGREGGAISSTPTQGTLTCLRCTFRLNEVRESSYGGAVHATGATTSFTQCVFDSNSISRANADNRGGAIYTTSGCTLTDCVFTGNLVNTYYTCCGDAHARAGAVYSSSAMTAVRVTFESNVAQCHERPFATGFAWGGAVMLESTLPAQFTDCVFNANIARNPLSQCSHSRSARAGAVLVTGGSDPVFLRCQFVGNRAESCSGGGTYGGTLFYESNCDGSIIDCTISGGYANTEGGGVYVGGNAAPSISRTTFSNCTTAATGSGGALYIAPSSTLVFVTDCRFTNCQSANGGAVWVNNARPRFDRCVFDRNTATSGSAIRSLGSGSLNIPTVCYSNFCGNSGVSSNWILGSFSDPHPNTPTNTFDASCGSDCNGNGIEDAVEIDAGLADCNGDGVPNTCEADCDGDLIPNVCEIAAGAPDCDADGVPDSCEVGSGDVNQDGVPDSCQPELEFDGLVTEIVPVTVAGSGLPNGAVCWRVYARFKTADTTVLALWGDPQEPFSISAAGGFWQSKDPSAGDFPSAIACDGAAASVLYDSYLTIGADCADGTPLASIGIDFTNFALGSITLDGGTTGGALYVTNNGVAAGAEQRVLLMQLTTNSGVKPSGQFNLVGEHSIAGGGAEWNAYRLTIPDPVLVDCNANGLHDSLEIASGSVSDCDLDGVPDGCQSPAAGLDCDGDGVSDFCELAAGAEDANNNGRPDECECIGDTNGDGAVNVDDLLDVIVAWGDTGASPADLDGDGVVGGFDLTLVLDNWGSCNPVVPPGQG